MDPAKIASTKAEAARLLACIEAHEEAPIELKEQWFKTELTVTPLEELIFLQKVATTRKEKRQFCISKEFDALINNELSRRANNA